MRKHYFIIITLFFVISKSNAQGFQEGYLTFKDSTTVIVPILIKINGRDYIHYEKKKKKKTKIIKIKKSKLIDFGIIENGQKKSKYAAFRFDTKAHDAFYIKNLTKDTVRFYFIECNKDVIKGFTKRGKKLSLTTKYVSTVFVEKNSKTVIYDNVNISPKRGFEKSLFLERKLDGTIKMYTVRIRKVELIKWFKNYFLTEPEEITIEDIVYSEPQSFIRHKIEGEYINGNILIKGTLQSWFLFGEEGIEIENQLRKYVNDCTSTYSKIGTKGYQIEDIYLIMKEYNELIKQQKCN